MKNASAINALLIFVISGFACLSGFMPHWWATPFFSGIVTGVGLLGMALSATLFAFAMGWVK